MADAPFMAGATLGTGGAQADAQVIGPASSTRIREVGTPLPAEASVQRKSADLKEVEVAEDVPTIAKVLSIIPLTWFTAPYTIEPNTVAAVVHMGTLTSINEEPGLHFDWPVGRSIHTVSIKQQTLHIPQEKVTDSHGVPVLVSAIVNFRVACAKKALFAVNDYKEYLENNATAALKKCVGSHTYEELKNHGSELGDTMTEALQKEVDFTGVCVTSMHLNELNYAPEIALAMLKKQQAGALLEARELIVEGSVKIAQDAVAKLTESGMMQMSDADKVKLVTNLLTVTCSEHEAQPALVM